MNVNWKTAIIYLLILFAAGALFLGLFPSNERLEEKTLSKVAADINSSRVKSIVVQENDLEVT
jgi:uncharacterized membrane protein YdcZ (DUF606 family)